MAASEPQSWTRDRVPGAGESRTMSRCRAWTSMTVIAPLRSSGSSCLLHNASSALPVHVNQRTVVFADLHRTEGAFEHDAPVDDAVGDRDQDVNRPAVRVLKRQCPGTVDDLAR